MWLASSKTVEVTGSELGPQIAPLVGLMKRIKCGDDLEDRCRPGGPVAHQVRPVGGDAGDLHLQRLGVPPAQPDRRVVAGRKVTVTAVSPLIVYGIDEVVKAVRFESWQATIRGDQEVRQALRKTLHVQFKIRDNDVYEKAVGYVREYYWRTSAYLKGRSCERNSTQQAREGSLRKVWMHEALDFTRWLALPENIQALSEVIEIELNDPKPEVGVGKFCVDIVAKDKNDRTVVIQNQLESTNHDHLGKIITDAAGLGADVVIWIV